MIETKKVELFGYLNGDKYSQKQYEKCQGYINDLSAFGWQPTQIVDERHSRYFSKYQILARETTMPNYDNLHKYEEKYEKLKNSISEYQRADFSIVCLLFLLFIFPGIIYLIYKGKQKQKINEHNIQCLYEMNQCVSSAKELIK